MNNRKTPQELADAIVKKGIKPSDLAARLGVNQSTVSRILTGDNQDPRASTMDALRDIHAELFPAKKPK